MTKETMIDVMNALIDDRCENGGVISTIAFLFDLGLTKKDLLELRFDEADIDYVIKTYRGE